MVTTRLVETRPAGTMQAGSRAEGQAETGVVAIGAESQGARTVRPYRALAAAGSGATVPAPLTARVALPARLREAAAGVEAVSGLCIAVALGWAIMQTWGFYDAELRPYARRASSPPVPRVVRLDDPAAVHRAQQVTDLLGEATSDIAAKHWDWARQALQQALMLDPENPDAAAMRAQLALEPEPTLTPDETAVRRQEDEIAELLGAATSFLEANRPDAAAPLIEKALALAPQNKIALTLRAELAATRESSATVAH